ncbi:MAG TPA: amidohydrolase family protein, partial [Actinomycetota bacterium]|nr:amidohydrolase family protein [Actinomycetota bacterium]
MIDGIPLVDVHLHPARRPTLKVDWQRWALEFGRGIPFDDLYDEAGTLRPDRFDAYLEAEGVDVALLMSEYSPRVTGIQPVEDLLPLVEHNPRRFRPIASLNPHLHHPITDELDRQLALGAAAVKLHPVHGGFSPTEGVLYLVYQRCAELGVPVVFHTGTSTFPGAVNRFGDPAPIDELIQHVPDLTVVLAHGGRGWWYDT